MNEIMKGMVEWSSDMFRPISSIMDSIRSDKRIINDKRWRGRYSLETSYLYSQLSQPNL